MGRKDIVPYHLYFLAVILSVYLAGCGEAADRAPGAVRGRLDLRASALGERGVVRLRGEWEFVWRQLVAPDRDMPRKRGLRWVSLPASWSRYESNGRNLSDIGYATYRLTLLLPKKRGEGDYALKLPQMSTASRVWADGELLAVNGTVGTSRDRSRPRYLPRTVVFTPVGDRTTLTIQVSNFHHRSGGIRRDILFGSAERLEREALLRLWFEQILFASFALAALFHLIPTPHSVVSDRRTQQARLYFGLFLAAISIRMLVTGEMMLIKLLPDFDWELQLRLEYLATYMTVPCLIAMTGAAFPEQFPARIRRAAILPAVILAGIVLALPCIVYSHLNGLFQLYAVCGMLLCIGITVRARLADLPNTGPLLFGLLVIFFIGLNQALFSGDMILNGDLSPIAMLAELIVLPSFLPLLRIPYGVLTYFLSASSLLLISLTLLAHMPDLDDPRESSDSREEAGETAAADAAPASPAPAAPAAPADAEAAMDAFCRIHDISRRERDILALSTKGLSNREIAERLFISLPTVKTHMRNLFVKVGAANRAQLGHRLREFERTGSVARE